MQRIIKAIAGILATQDLRDRLPEQRQVELELSITRVGTGL